MKDIAVVLFASSSFDKAAQGLMGAARRLADQAGASLRAVIVGNADGLAAEVARIADAVIVADQPELADYRPEVYLNALTQLCRELSPAAVLLSNDAYSQEIAPRLAHRLGGSAVGDVTEIRVQGEAFQVVRQVYGGKAQAVIELKRSPAVVCLRARAFEPALPRATAGQITSAALDSRVDQRTRIVERTREESGEARLEDARIIVSGGRGVGSREAFAAELQPLAELLGARMAASRAACDAGWAPATWQVGQTGKKVAPELYLAIGISGASQHMSGISEAKTIAAINIDPEAPIFKHCRFGIVGDYHKILPLVRDKLAAVAK